VTDEGADPFRRAPSHFEDANGSRFTDIVAFMLGLESFTGAMVVIMVRAGSALGAFGVVTALIPPIMPPVATLRWRTLSITGRMARNTDREVAIMVRTVPVHA
jgi:hypothetical protein